MKAPVLKCAVCSTGLSQPEVAKRAGVSTMMLKRAEGSGKPAASAEAMATIRRALEKAGVILTPENGDGPGVKLRKGKHV